MKSVEDVHEIMNWWLYYSAVSYMFRRIVKQSSGCYVQNIQMEILQKVYVLFEKKGTEISGFKTVFQKKLSSEYLYTYILPIQLNFNYAVLCVSA
jgi:hypothetical protein